MSNSVDKQQRKAERKAERREWVAFRKKEFVKNINIVKQLVLRSIKVQYRNSVIGVFWTILNPLLNMLVMYLVFSNMFDRGGAEKETYALYLLCGNIVFGMMRTATFQSLPSIVQNRGLLTKNKMSYNVFPLSCTLSAVVNFGFSFIALLGVMLVVWIQGQAVFSLNIFLAFVGLPALFLFSYGLSLILAALYTFFRDVRHFYNVFLTLWMYLTPIFYSIDIFYKNDSSFSFMGFVIKCNPMYYYVEYFTISQIWNSPFTCCNYFLLNVSNVFGVQIECYSFFNTCFNDEEIIKFTKLFFSLTFHFVCLCFWRMVC